MRRALLVLALAACAGPILWQVRTALTPTEALTAVPPEWWPRHPTLQHVETVLGSGAFTRSLLNSAIVAVGATALALAVGTPGAYAAATLRLAGGRLLLGAALAASLLPPVSLVSPLFRMLGRLGALNTYPGLIVPHAALALPIVLWVLAATFRELPPALREAAEVDGCSAPGALWRVVLPAAMPGVVTAAILAFTVSWNELLLALTLAGAERVQTATVALAFFPGLEEFPWGQIAAASLVVALPLVVLVLVFQRRIASGLTAGVEQ